MPTLIRKQPQTIMFTLFLTMTAEINLEFGDTRIRAAAGPDRCRLLYMDSMCIWDDQVASIFEKVSVCVRVCVRLCVCGGTARLQMYLPCTTTYAHAVDHVDVPGELWLRFMIF
jgi:hypothetical protein